MGQGEARRGTDVDEAVDLALEEDCQVVTWLWRVRTDADALDGESVARLACTPLDTPLSPPTATWRGRDESD